MLTLICGNEDEVVAVRTAWAERRLDQALGGHPFAVWLGETFRFGSDGTEKPALAEPAGRHRRNAPAVAGPGGPPPGKAAGRPVPAA